jgi:K+-sensing histidine kinase KdpD
MTESLAADTERLRRLQLLTDAALSSLELEGLLSALLERLHALLEVDTCAVLLLDEEANELVARAAVGIEEEVEQGVRIPVGRGFAGRVAAERRPVILDSVDHADVLNPILSAKGIKSLVGVPLVVRDEVIGVLHVGSIRPRRFTGAETELLQLAAQRAAIAIEHAQLFEEEREARTRIEHVQAITDIALAHLDVHELLEVLLPRIRNILAADTCAVLLLDEETDELVARAAVGIEEEVEQGVRIPVGGGFAGRVAAERRPVILDDVDHAHVLNPILREKGIKSMLGVPLVVRGDVIGVLHVGTLKHRKFTADDTELLGLVAERVALAIERGQLHEQMVALDAFKSNLVAVASHELRTPASSIYGVFATLAERNGIPGETREQLIQVGYEQSERLRRLIEQLLDLSQLEAGKLDVNVASIRLRDALDETVASLPDRPQVQLEVPPTLTVLADSLVLERVVSNLLVNAERYGRPPIVVSAQVSAHELRIVVQDHGSGVPDDLRPRLFEPFSRGAEGRGPGLGLSIARTYARAHGGELFFVPGENGARFELVIPQR